MQPDKLLCYFTGPSNPAENAGFFLAFEVSKREKGKRSIIEKKITA
jgi:hypothetical protein